MAKGRQPSWWSPQEEEEDAMIKIGQRAHLSSFSSPNHHGCIEFISFFPQFISPSQLTMTLGTRIPITTFFFDDFCCPFFESCFNSAPQYSLFYGKNCCCRMWDVCSRRNRRTMISWNWTEEEEGEEGIKFIDLCCSQRQKDARHPSKVQVDRQKTPSQLSSCRLLSCSSKVCVH